MGGQIQFQESSNEGYQNQQQLTTFCAYLVRIDDSETKPCLIIFAHKNTKNRF